LRESQATRKPDVDFSFSAVNERLNLDVAGFQSIDVPGFMFPGAAGPFEALEAQVHIRQSLFNLESVRRKDAVRAAIAAAQTETDEVRDQIAGQVAWLYLQAQRDASSVDTTQALVVTAESALKEVGDRNAEGQALALDVSQARVEVAAAKPNLLRAQRERARTETDFLKCDEQGSEHATRVDRPVDVSSAGYTSGRPGCRHGTAIAR
jgi:outer membrane protein TolC